MASATAPRTESIARFILFAPPFLVGLFLRLYGLSGQILLDDEWHSLNFVLDKSFLALLTTHGLGANCIPQNIVNWILLHAGGWSELALYLPSVLCGIAGLMIFPRLVSRLAGRTVAFFFSVLFAISPCLIFYSRIVRPSSMVVFFGFLSLLCLALWTREGRPRQLRAYAVCGFAAIYFHPYAALPVLAPLAGLFLAADSRRPGLAEATWISRKKIGRTGFLIVALLAIFLGPAHWRNPWWLQELARDRVSAQGLWEFLSLLAGTRLALSKLLFASLIGGGLVLWIRREFRVGLLFLSVGIAFALLLIFATQDGIHTGILIARFNILVLPVSMLLAAAALDRILARLPVAGRLAAGLPLICGLAAGSPLWRTFDLPNNFMHHSAFQDSYAPFDWSTSRLRALAALPQMPRERIPAFYSALARDPSVPGIVEFPMYMGDSLNFHYYYQHFHRKPVAVGYVAGLSFPPLPSKNGFIYQALPVDYVFSRARSLGLLGKLHFANLIPLTEADGLSRAHRGWWIVLHRDLLWETSGDQGPFNFHPPIQLERELTARFGAPVFADDQIQAWRIP